ncbi:MAG: fluoride efflux transporter CrcB [Nitrospiria bacterium]
MQKLMMVGLGGFIGAVLRYLLSGWVQTWTKSAVFPYGTLAVNLLGCLGIGLLSHLVEARNLWSPEARMFVFIGTLGAFTTFSTFGNETMKLLRNGETLLSFMNIGAHTILGLAAVWLGQVCAELIWS